MILSAQNLNLPGRLDAASAAFAPGRVTAICGPNGAGKSSLLACLAGLRAPASGTVELDEINIYAMPPRARAQVLGFYTQDPVIIAAAMPLLLWVWVFHVGDAGQTLAAFVLRAHKISTAPLLIYAGAIWGVGMGGGYFLAFGHADWVPDSLRGAPGFWSAATAGLVTAAAALSGFLAFVHRQEARASAR